MMHDDVHCKMSLPEDAPACIKESPFFQTYDLGKGMGRWVITEEGELQCEGNLEFYILGEACGFEGDMPAVAVKYKRKRIELFGSNLRGGGPRGKKYVWFTDDGSDYISITYVVQIRNGKVSSIKEKSRSVQPALPYAEFNKR